MRKLLVMTASLISLIVLFSACSKNESEVTEPTLEGTRWTADDDIAKIIYGGKCTTTIEFLTKKGCQLIDVHPQLVGSGYDTKVTQGTYTYDGKKVTWTIDGHTIEGTVSGSVIMTKEGRQQNRVYTKQ